MTDLNMLAVVDSYDGMRDAFRDRAAALGITREMSDEFSGLQSGYSGKILAPNATQMSEEVAQCVGELTAAGCPADVAARVVTQVFVVGIHSKERKKFGWRSLALLCDAYGLKIAILEDPEATKLIRERVLKASLMAHATGGAAELARAGKRRAA